MIEKTDGMKRVDLTFARNCHLCGKRSVTRWCPNCTNKAISAVATGQIGTTQPGEEIKRLLSPPLEMPLNVLIPRLNQLIGRPVDLEQMLSMEASFERFVDQPMFSMGETGPTVTQDTHSFVADDGGVPETVPPEVPSDGTRRYGSNSQPFPVGVSGPLTAVHVDDAADGGAVITTIIPGDSR
ncbi:MAG: hypothetical protein WC526_02390 [Patescibacteria group bacterium]